MMKRTKPFPPNGFTLTELLVVFLIFTFLMIAVTGIILMAARTYRESQVQSQLFTQASNVMDLIQRGEAGLQGLMKGRSGTAAISGANSEQINFMIDRNSDYTEALGDDTEIAIYYDNGDGSDTTLEDNRVIFETDPSGSAVAFAAGRNVESLSFSKTNNIVTVNLTVADRVRGQTVRLTLNRNIMMRN